MKPGGGGAPGGALGEKIAAVWGGHAEFVEAFKTAAAGRFGSGWVWLVDDNGELKIVSTPNAEMPAAQGVTPLLVVDVWEHAYYLDYQNLRPVYTQTFFEKLANWDFAAANMANAK
jgi:Fe-Mn family superoxide dismutase